MEPVHYTFNIIQYIIVLKPSEMRWKAPKIIKNVCLHQSNNIYKDLLINLNGV